MERIQVVVEAKDAASGVLRGIAREFGGLSGVIEDMTGKSINWGNVTTQATRLISDVMKEAFTVATEYAGSVRDIALASGATAEEASRLIQVLDDFEIQADDITTATRALTKNGLAPTIETIAQLSDEYIKLNTAEERNAFITENLGRGGSKWANALKEGGPALLELNAAVNQSLILNDAQIRQYEEMRLNQDEFNDNVMAMQIMLVNGLVPAINSSIDSFGRWFTTMQDAQLATNLVGTGSLPILIARLSDNAEGADIAATATRGFRESVQLSGDAADEAATDYGKLVTAALKLNDATKEGIKLAGYQALSDSLTKSDGGLSAEEAQILQDAGLALGIMDAGAIKSATSIMQMAAAVDVGTASLEEYIAMLNSIPASVTTQINAVTVNGTQGSLLAGNDAYYTPRADGGPVELGRTYLVGERGPELFTPKTSGNITPNDQMGGNTYNIYGNVSLEVGSGSSFLENR